MKERGMIFNDEMVRAILDGRKTQTRRIMRNQPAGDTPETPVMVRNKNWAFQWYDDRYGESGFFSCPLGQPGDLIWVREAFQGPLVDFECSDDLYRNPEKYQKPENCVYRADGVPAPEYYDADDNLRCGWRPSIHMSRWASRITLEITDVRIEKLASISNEDAGKEGYPANQENYGGSMDKWLWFRQLWDSIYPEQTFKHNPWVWVIEFKRIDGGTTP